MSATPTSVIRPRQSRATSAICAAALAFALGGTLGSTLGGTCSALAAVAYPSRPVTIIVPFAAGGSADVYARLLAPHLQKALGQPFIVDDRPGAGSIIGTEFVKNSPPDGYTLLLVSNTQTVNETLFKKKPFKLMSDFKAVAPINSADLVLVTRPTLGVNSLADLIKLAKEKPGTLTFASSGPGTPYHMAGELFKQMAGIDMLHVPYKGSSAARIDVIGGHVDMMFDAPTTMKGFITSGKVKGLATTGTTKSDVLATLPTAASVVPGYDAVIWLGVMAPKGTPDDIVATLNQTISDIVKDPKIQADWKEQGAEAVIMNPKQFTDFMTADVIKWKKVVEISGATPDQ